MMVPAARGFVAAIIVFILLAAALAAPRSGLAAGPSRIALVIGNSAYTDLPPLANPANDAQLMAATLRKLGFEVIERIDADQETMQLAVFDLQDRLTEAGHDAVWLFYYAGHGVQVNGENYLIPLSSGIEQEREVSLKAVSAGFILGQMEVTSNAMNIVVLDACRNNPPPRGERSGTMGLAKMEAPRGSLVAYSTGPGEVARDGAGMNSPYTTALARELLVPGVAIEQIFKNVRRAVMDDTGQKQTPWELSSLMGDFFFAGEPAGESGETLAGDALAGGKFDADKAFWQSIQGSENPADFEAYISEFGDEGIFVRLAGNRIIALNETSTANRSADTAGESDQHVSAQDLVKARQMFLELTETAGVLMGSEDVPMIERLEKVRGMLGEVVDFKPMATFVLGDHRERITPEQWEEFYLVYQELFLSGYSFTDARSWAGQYEIKGIRPYGPDTLVTVAFVDEREQSLVVGLRIRKKPGSFFGFKIVDAINEGISLLVTQKGDFGTILIREGVDGLIRTLEDKFGKVAEPIDIPG